MSPAPLLSSFLVRWLAAQGIERVEREVVDELKRRVETGDLGDYDGILFKNSAKSKSDSAKNSPHSKNAAPSADFDRKNCADVGVVAASKRELVGILDQIGAPKTTRGNGFQYFAGVWKGRKVALVETGSGFDAARKGTEALIDVFRPARIVSAGFAIALTPTLKAGALVVPNRILSEDGETLDLARRLLESESDRPNADSSENFETSSDFAKNAPPTFAPSFLDRFAVGALLSVDRIVSSSDEKKRFAEETGASILDREGRAVADVCAALGVPFLPLRVVVDDSAPREVKNVVASQSAARKLGAFFGAVSKRPSSALDLYKLKERSLAAADKLAAALGAILTAQN